MSKASQWLGLALLAGGCLVAGTTQAQTASGEPQARTAGSPIGGIVVNSAPGPKKPTKPTKLTAQTPVPIATPTTGVAGKSHSEAAPQGPAPTKPKPRPTQKPGVKFGQ